MKNNARLFLCFFYAVTLGILGAGVYVEIYKLFKTLG